MTYKYNKLGFHLKSCSLVQHPSELGFRFNMKIKSEKIISAVSWAKIVIFFQRLIIYN